MITPFVCPTVSVAQACEALGCKKSRLFELLRDGTLERAPRYGREIRIYTASIARALAPPVPKNRTPRVPSPHALDRSLVKPA